MLSNVSQGTTPDPRRRRALVTISVAGGSIIVDATIVDVAIPSVIAGLHLTATPAEWGTSVCALETACTDATRRGGLVAAGPVLPGLPASPNLGRDPAGDDSERARSIGSTGG